VLEAARALGYRPNAIARAMITRRSRIIGVAMANLHNLFYPDALEALSRGLRARLPGAAVHAGGRAQRGSDAARSGAVLFRHGGGGGPSAAGARGSAGCRVLRQRPDGNGDDGSGTHDGFGAFGPASGAEVLVVGIAQTELAGPRIRQAWWLVDELSLHRMIARRRG
jgi:hypothetical protein